MKDLFGEESTPPAEYFTEEEKKEWFEAFIEWCNNEYFTKGDMQGRFCCGYDWCCDECKMCTGEACYDCADTIITILKRNNVQIDYLDFDFKKWEDLANAKYKEKL